MSYFLKRAIDLSLVLCCALQACEIVRLNGSAASADGFKLAVPALFMQNIVQGRIGHVARSQEAGWNTVPMPALERIVAYLNSENPDDRRAFFRARHVCRGWRNGLEPNFNEFIRAWWGEDKKGAELFAKIHEGVNVHALCQGNWLQALFGLSVPKTLKRKFLSKLFIRGPHFHFDQGQRLLIAQFINTYGTQEALCLQDWVRFNDKLLADNEVVQARAAADNCRYIDVQVQEQCERAPLSLWQKTLSIGTRFVVAPITDGRWAHIKEVCIYPALIKANDVCTFGLFNRQAPSFSDAVKGALCLASVSLSPLLLPPEIGTKICYFLLANIYAKMGTVCAAPEYFYRVMNGAA